MKVMSTTSTLKKVLPLGTSGQAASLNFTAAEGAKFQAFIQTRFSFTVILLVLILFWPGISCAQQATLTDDANTESSIPNKNFGAAKSIQVSVTEKGFVKFNLTPTLPIGTTGSRVEKATLKLFVGGVGVPGSFDIYRVVGTWAEENITEDTAPVLGSAEGTVAIGAQHAGRWVTVELTQLVKDWLDGVVANNGVALVAQVGGAQVSLNSKENSATSHEARLEIILNHATTADTATNFSGSLAGDVTGTQSATVVSSVGGQTAAVLASGSAAANAATDSNTPNTIVKRDGAGNFSAGAVNADTQYNIGNKTVLSIGGTNNLFVGNGAGANNTTGNDNTFIGAFAGNKNTTGNNNAFLGTGAGFFSTTAINNSFYGVSAGNNNASGSDNSFFGRAAGQNNTSGARNVFIGESAGLSNTTENQNSFIGFRANGLSGISNATAIGANAAVTRFNSLVLGSINGVNGATADTSVGIGTTAPTQRLHVVGNIRVSGAGNGFIFADGTKMTAAGATLAANNFNGNQSVTGNISATGSISALSAVISGPLLVDGSTLRVDPLTNRVGIGTSAPAAKLDVVGPVNTSTQYNIGNTRVLSVAGTNNTFVGISAGRFNTIGFDNSFFGTDSGRLNTTGTLNTFFGAEAGEQNTTGFRNSFFGFGAGRNNDSGNRNTFLGESAGNTNITGSNNTVIGVGADVGSPGLNHATAIGAGAVVSTNNTVVLGRSSDRIKIPGVVDPYLLSLLRIGDGLPLCQSDGTTPFTSDGEIVVCGLTDNRSSLRYKTAIQPFTGGLDIVRRLRPITFTWRDRPTRDLGLAAEDVAQVEPLLVTYNRDGQVEGVKYAHMSAVLIDAIQQQHSQLIEQRRLLERQQNQLEQQRNQIQNLKRLIVWSKGGPRSAIKRHGRR